MQKVDFNIAGITAIGMDTDKAVSMHDLCAEDVEILGQFNDYNNLHGEQLMEFLNAAAGIEHLQAAEEIRDIANVLKITENTDKNIKESMESLLRIADRLERRNRSGGSEVFTKGGAGKAAHGRKDG